MPLSRADWKRLRRIIREENAKADRRVIEALNEALRAEAQLLFLQSNAPSERPTS